VTRILRSVGWALVSLGAVVAILAGTTLAMEWASEAFPDKDPGTVLLVMVIAGLAVALGAAYGWEARK
jgi:hypothetical protein